MKDVEIIKARNVLSSRARTNLTKRLRVAAYCRVSTDSEDQLNSYKSQVQHYTDLIKSKSEWDLAGIYADEAITGTQVTKREDFQRLINDCMNGDVDMIITKSISRFARNTLDTLKYVRMLKEKGIAVFFEEENINTLTMDGELLLVILSSVAQQEVENISANVKKGLKMKMQRGELVGFQGCLGYDYHPEDKSITINEEEAEIVRYIFRRYIEGAGGSVIAHELENLGYRTKRGSTRWAETTVIGIIKNEKYKGDILMGKTFTLDPISKRRLDNFGEEDQFYIRDHHEAIISEEMFEKAQEILKRRAKPRRLGTDGKREKFSRKYAFSCMLECGFCGGTLTRRSWHSGSQYNKTIWQCVTATKKGKKFCPDSKGIAEETIEQAFIESYRLLCQNNKDVLDEFIARTEETLSDSNASKQLAKVEKDIAALDTKRAKLVDMRLEEIIDKETYEQKYFDLSSQIDQLQKQREDLQQSAETESTMKRRISEFRKTLEQNEVLNTFDRYVFESIVEKVIVGGYDENGNKDPSMLTFIYKTGFENSVDGANFKPPRKNSKAAKQCADLCSDTTDEVNAMCFYHSNDTRGDGGAFGAGGERLIPTKRKGHRFAMSLPFSLCKRLLGKIPFILGQQGQKTGEGRAVLFGEVHRPKGQRLHLRQGNVAQPGVVGTRKAGDQSEGVAGLHQREDALLLVAEEDLVGTAVAHGLALDLEEHRRAGGGTAGGDPPRTLQLLQRDGAAGGQGMLPAANAHDRAAEQLQVTAFGRGRLPEGEHHVDRPLPQQVLQRVKGDEPQDGQNVRLGPAQAGEGRAEEPQLRGAAAADDQPGEGLALELLHPGLGEDGHFQDLSGVLGEQKALLGQTHAFAGALEQLDAQLAFQRVDLVADSRLGDGQVLSRPGEVQAVGHFHKALQLCGIHKIPPKRKPVLHTNYL